MLEPGLNVCISLPFHTRSVFRPPPLTLFSVPPVLFTPSSNPALSPSRCVSSPPEGACLLGERERAHAILLACRHLPLPLLTPPGHRARLLAEAKRTLERVGDRRSVQDCQQILLRLGGGTTIAAS